MNIFESLLNNPVATGIVYSSMIGWIGYQVKDIPMKIINFIKPLITYHVEIPQDGGTRPYRIIDRLTMKYTPLFNNELMMVSTVTQDAFLLVGNMLEPTKCKSAISGIQTTCGIGTNIYYINGMLLLITKSKQQKQNRDYDVYDYNITMFIWNKTKFYELIQTEYDVLDKESTHIKDYSFGLDSNNNASYFKYEVTYRTIDTIFNEHTTSITNDLSNFITNRSFYNSLGVPYHRGYMFHGTPGTGKTSMINVLATNFNIPIFKINLTMLNDMTFISIRNLIKEVVAENRYKLFLVVYEDIDCMNLSTRDSKDKETVSLSTILNFLDGTDSINGMITIMTSNDISNLDPAMLRKGRIDKTYEFRNLTPTLAQEMVKRFIPDSKLTFINPINPTILQGIIIDNIEQQGELETSLNGYI